jgi:acetyl-CoA carboxylase carboxyltransferase component
LEAIVEFFRQKGWDMATSTFRQHVRDARKARAKAQDNGVEQSSAPQRSSPKRTNRRKVDEFSADDTNRNLRPVAEMSPAEADPFDLALAPEPEVTSDESQRLF